MSQSVKYVGLDVHKETIAVAVAEDGKRSEVREHGEIANTPAALTKLFGKLGGPGVELHICYEAGPCGYGIQRQVVAAGHSCVVVAPSLIPSRPGDRIKTDRRDAVKLARLHRAGELTSVWVPDSAHEAMRDLVRARLAAVRSLRHARQQLSGFLLRHGHHYHRPAWTQMHRRWLSGLRFAEDAHHIVLEDCIATIDAAKERRDRLAKVHLRMSRRVRQWHERLPPARPVQPDIILHHGVAAAEAMLIAQPFKDPLRRMPLLHRRRPVPLQNRIDHRQQRPQLRLRHRLRPRVARRQREPAHLQHRLAAQAKHPRRLTATVAIDEHETPNRGIHFHTKHPRPPPKGATYPLACFYAATLSTTPAFQWLVLSPPCTDLRIL